jgi:trigger factor
MKITVAKEGENVVKMDITIPAKEASSAYNSAAKRYAQYVNINGFRKGKAPVHLVERQVGTERIKIEAIENLLPNIIDQAVKKNDLDLITQPYVSYYEFDSGKELKIIAHAETRPEVTLGKYKDLTVSVDDTPIPADGFKNALDSVLTQYTTEETVTKRAANATDIAIIDFDGYVKGEKIQGGEGKGYPLNLGQSNFIPGFAEAIVGHKTGEEFEINVKFPKEYHDEKLKGQPAVFKIKINEIKEKKLPELTDEFAQKLGPFKTVADLEADIKRYLEDQREKVNKQNSEREVFKAVIDSAKVNVPQSMIERESENLKEEYKARLAQQGVTWEMIAKNQNEAEMLNMLKSEAASRIKNALVIDKIIKTEKLHVESQDLDGKLREVSAAYGMEPAQLIRQFGQNREFLSTISQQAVNDKVRDFLMLNNKVVLKEGKKPAKPAKETKAEPKKAAVKKAAPAKKSAPKKSAKKATAKKSK